MLQDLLTSARSHGLFDPRAWAGRLVIWLAAIGVGLVVVAFAELSDRAYLLFTSLQARWFWLPLVLTPAVGIACVWLSRRVFAGSEGGGIPQVMAAGDDRVDDATTRRFVSLRIAFGKFGLVLAALAGGFSVGREGPSVQIGASLMYACRGWLPRDFALDPRNLLVAGGAAGMAAAFNTPLAGIVFAIEQLARRFEQGTNGVLIAAIVWAGLVSLALLGNYNYFGRLFVDDVTFAILPVVLVAGVVCGLAGGLFSRLLLYGLARLPRLAQAQARHPLLFAGACGLGVAVLGLATAGATLGGGYETTREMLVGQVATPWYYSIGRFAATLLSTITGMPGGIFAPSLAVGAGIGADLLPLTLLLTSAVSAAAVTALCMSGYLAAVTHAPLTAFIVVMEMVDGHAMVLSLMAVAMIASLVARLVSPPLYETIAERMLAQLPGTAPPGEANSAANGIESHNKRQDTP
ncbi:MAG TPA: chloride channel protein [Burkholderiaceae bacterium]|nr:chloride channel protein [Burkholderiaceae bacterium]